ncbi:hypothetical protein HPB47_016709 [Ixodes persulcatus]|uniref:Uncharacterized protein n=1 Tax=Ixodes persulcatus TaxID=34615 RepID=A0AC60QR60_IXOPE|nr:hypothetical protein HPB47_016709 [Ixodes persulcatus]
MELPYGCAPPVGCTCTAPGLPSAMQDARLTQRQIEKVLGGRTSGSPEGGRVTAEKNSTEHGRPSRGHGHRPPKPRRKSPSTTAETPRDHAGVGDDVR